MRAPQAQHLSEQCDEVVGAREKAIRDVVLAIQAVAILAQVCGRLALGHPETLRSHLPGCGSRCPRGRRMARARRRTRGDGMAGDSGAAAAGGPACVDEPDPLCRLDPWAGERPLAPSAVGQQVSAQPHDSKALEMARELLATVVQSGASRHVAAAVSATLWRLAIGPADHSVCAQGLSKHRGGKGLRRPSSDRAASGVDEVASQATGTSIGIRGSTKSVIMFVGPPRELLSIAQGLGAAQAPLAPEVPEMMEAKGRSI